MTSYAKGELRIAVLGDLLRNPASTYQEMSERLGTERDVCRITLGRMVERGWVRRVGDRYVCGRAGIEYLAQVRRWVSA